MAERMLFSKIAATIVIVGTAASLAVSAVYEILTPRELGIGMLAWFAAILLFAATRRWLATRTGLSYTGTGSFVRLDDRTRRHMLRRIWMNKVWVGLLALCLPVGIAEGTAHHAWLPTIAGVTMNLLLMYSAIRDLRTRRALLDSQGQSTI